MGRRLLLCVAVSAMAVVASAQTPQPFPRPGAAPPAPSTPAPRPAPNAPPTQPAPPIPVPAAPSDPGAPTEATLGLPIYPTAQFISSYDAGRGQRYYIFGASAPYADLVAYYRTVLKERGNQVFEAPPTHMFEVGRFREETMAFPPGVTIKDWSSGGTSGYPNPKANGQPARFATIVMIVPAPAGAPR